MALSACPECRNPVSDKAMVCPKCGHPVGYQRMLKRMVVLSIVILGIVAAFIVILFSSLGLIG